MRTASQSSQRFCASIVEQLPSVIESPNVTMAPVCVDVRTSIAFSHNIDVVVLVNGVRVSSAATSPAPLAVR